MDSGYGYGGLTELVGYGYGSVTELPEVPGLWHRHTELTEVPGGYKTLWTRTPDIVARILQNSQKFLVCGTGIQNSQKFRAGTKHDVPVPRVLWHGSYRTMHIAIKPGVDNQFEGLGAQFSTLKFSKVCGFRVRVWESYRTSRVRVWKCYKTSRSSGFVAQAYRTHTSSGRVQNIMYPYPGYCGTDLTELTEVPGTGMKVLQNFQKFRVRI